MDHAAELAGQAERVKRSRPPNLSVRIFLNRPRKEEPFRTGLSDSPSYVACSSQLELMCTISVAAGSEIKCQSHDG
jgi:hypothetical protein